MSWGAFGVNARADRRLTPLHPAAAHGFLRNAELRVDAGADVNAIAEERLGVLASMLRMAVVNDKAEIVELLLKAEAEVVRSGEVLVEAVRRPCRMAAKILLQARGGADEVKAAAEKLVQSRADH